MPIGFMSRPQSISEAQRRARRAAVRARAGRVPLLIIGIATLVAAAWGGLLRMGVVLPVPEDAANWITFHGPLMVCGFLGTVIALERAVGLQKLWTYAAPLLAATGSAWIITGGMGSPGPWLIFGASVVFVLVSIYVVRLSRALFTVIMGLGAVTWAVGNALWVAHWGFPRIVPWWIAFLALVILGERLDLTRFQRPVPSARPLLLLVTSVFLLGVVVSAFHQAYGERLLGAGLLGITAWLVRFDTARRSLKQQGLPRFMAVCLLAGYFWLGLSGLLFTIHAPMESGFRYDAVLHAFFVGFVFSMIFGHAPVIFPAVLLLSPAFHWRLYIHVALLHASLLLRVTGDLADWLPGRQWGGILNSIAIAMFLLNTVSMMLPWTRPKSAG
jgi:hypothetical protein